MSLGTWTPLDAESATLTVSNQYGTGYTADSMTKGGYTHWCSEINKDSATITIDFPGDVTASGFRIKPFSADTVFEKFHLQKRREILTGSLPTKTGGWYELNFQETRSAAFELKMDKGTESYFCIKKIEIRRGNQCSLAYY